MKYLNTVKRELAFLFKCLKATYLSMNGNTVVYTSFFFGEYRYEYVTDFKKSFGIIVLGSMRKNTSRNFVEGLVELKKVPKVTVNHSIHILNPKY